MDNFEVVLTLSIIQSECKDLLEKTKKCCKMIKRLKEIFEWISPAQNLVMDATPTM